MDLLMIEAAANVQWWQAVIEALLTTIFVLGALVIFAKL